MNDRVYKLSGVRNFRDFGGYASSYGGQVRRGVLFRSGHYAEATDEDLSAVKDLNITLQVDLRRPDERERMAGKWSALTTITHDGGRETDAPHTRFLQHVEANAEVADNWMNEYYKKAPFKAHHIEMFSNWFNKLEALDADQAGLVNCAAGKDRTGILCALTHHILGVSEDDIVADYDLTNHAAEVDERLPEAANYFNDFLGKSYEAEVYRPFLGVHPRYLETALTTIKGEAGSIDTYITERLGVSQQVQEGLRARLIKG